MLISLLTLICCCLLTSYGLLIGYYRKAWTDIPAFTPARRANTRISVLIPARNEESNIAHCIRSLEQQSYPKTRYEIIVIDDHSTDTTREIVTNLHPPDMDLVYIHLADEKPPSGITASGGTHPRSATSPISAHYITGKKSAITTGVAISTGDLIVTTDADCRFDPDWLNTLAAFYEEKNAKFIAAPVRMGEPHGPSAHPADARPTSSSLSPNASRADTASFLSVFQTLDFITLQGITGAAVSKSFHAMCNGANLAYEKNAFLQVDGFQGIDSIPSGDDMLLMYKIYTRYPDNVFFLKNANAIVSTKPEKNWAAFFHQRVRWASKADRYDDKRIFGVLLLVYALNAMFLILAIAACWNSWWLWPLIIGLIAKTLLEYPFVYSVSSFFGQRPLLRWFPVMQPFHIVYTVIIGWTGKFGSYRWKDRTITK